MTARELQEFLGKLPDSFIDSEILFNYQDKLDKDKKEQCHIKVAKFEMYSSPEIHPKVLLG